MNSENDDEEKKEMLTDSQFNQLCNYIAKGLSQTFFIPTQTLNRLRDESSGQLERLTINYENSTNLLKSFNDLHKEANQKLNQLNNYDQKITSAIESGINKPAQIVYPKLRKRYYIPFIIFLVIIFLMFSFIILIIDNSLTKKPTIDLQNCANYGFVSNQDDKTYCVIILK